MKSKLVSAFEYFMAQVKPLPTCYRQEAYRIFVEDSLDELLDFCEKNGSISPDCNTFLHYDMFLFEVDEKGYYLNYFEDDYDKRTEFIKRIFDNNIDEYAKNYKE